MNENEELEARRRRPTCAEIVAAQNETLSGLCSKKINRLSCRCSGCASDETNPVIMSPADAALLNTAYDGHGGFLSAGMDSHWEVALGTTVGTPNIPSSGWIPAFVVINSTLVNTPPGAWANSPFSNASWISYYKDAAQGGENIDLYFRYRFNLSPAVNPNAFAVTMRFFADNQVADIFVNGVAQSSKPNGSGILPQQGFPAASGPYSTSGFGAHSDVTITLDNSWRWCDNEIVVYVKSGSPYAGFLAQNAVAAPAVGDGCDCPCDCQPAAVPDLHPCITVKWGDSECDCLETDDVEVLCITVCNCYSNVAFGGLSIGQVIVTDAAGNPVPALPDGTPSVQIIPSGPICFGDIGPCADRDHPTCVSREVVLYTRGAVGKKYRLSLRGICFTVCHEYQSDQCFTMELCRD